MSYVRALQDTLAAEHAALYLYALLGARTSRSAEPGLSGLLEEGYQTHRARRDRLEAVLRDLGEQPVAAEPAYAIDPDERGAAGSSAAVRRARRIERSCAQAYARLVESSPSADRRWAVVTLSEAAVRELAFRGAPEMLPGSDEDADR